MMVRPRKAFLTRGISLNFLPIKIITDLGIEKQRSQLNKRLWKTPFLSTPQAQLQPGHLTWRPGLPSLPRQGTLRPFRCAGGWAQGLVIPFCCSFLLTLLLCSGGGPPRAPFLQHPSRDATFSSDWLTLWAGWGRF